MSDGNFCAHCGALIYYGPHICYGGKSQTVPVQHPHTTMVTRDAGLEIQGPVFRQVMEELAAIRARHEQLRNRIHGLTMKHPELAADIGRILGDE